MLSHTNLVWNALSVQSYYPYAAGDACLVVLPLYHTASLNFSALPYLLAGATVVLLASYNPETALALIDHEGCRQTILLPQMWQDIATLVQPGSLARARHLVCGGGPTDVAAIERLQAISGGEYSLIMGMTEVGPMLCRLDPADVVRKNGAIGKPVLSQEVQVVDEEFRPVTPGSAGEMIIRGPGVFAGYWNQPLATARSMTGRWFHGGDYVQVDDEGFFTIVDRMKDMIRSGGENIYSLEIERVLERHPAIAEAAVIGVEDPDWGESVMAFVVPRASAALQTDDVVQWCRQHLASYKKPRFVRFLHVLPRNATGKVLKRELRARAHEEARNRQN
jgi:fatty-acyl-CoA synthase